ncbi:MAG: T9SS type A sorting domain-containing protein [Candidatus Marinimicrobia bacterium]|nr:T9SS type A sorting domain-containing protein [Candidatus Neomarinimicrobiota bacterium]MCF7827377.1 T9SS type A sorting domain-containing protein [Candidatus Neomarinimicrobiota bacterium]MCF7881390.1 T9SS type A sorting domain-containing protein [Candidatus Neomarinimicrobiota bacterium]
MDKATGGEAISADNANGTFTTLSGPVITETTAGQLPLGTIEFVLPNGFEWDTGGTDPSVTVTLAPGQNATTQLQISFVSRTTTKITFEVTNTSNDRPTKPGQATFSGFRVRPTRGTLPNSGYIKNAGFSGPGGTTNYGDLGMVAGDPTQVRVETSADGSGDVVPAQNLSAGNSITVYSVSRDQYGNFLQNIAAESWSLVNITGGVVSGDLVPAGDNKSAVLTGNIVGTAEIQAGVTDLTPVNSGTISVVPGPATTLALTTQPSTSAVAGTVFTQQPVLTIRDDYGNTVTGDNSSQVTASINTGNAALQGTTVKQAASGVVTYTDLHYTKAEQIDLQFSTSGLQSVVSNTITVSPADADSLVFAVQPSNGARNAVISPVIEVQIVDFYGNPVSQTGNPISLNLTTGGGSISNAEGINTNSSGIAIFSNVTFNQTGTKRVTAVDDNSVLKSSVESDPFVISAAGKLSKFSIEIASGDTIPGQVAGQSFFLKITALDGEGNVLDGGPNRDSYDTWVSISSNGNLITGTGSTANFSAGVLSSHEVALDTTGEFTITATDTGGTISSSSNTFTVEAAAYDTTTSTIAADSSTLIANGTNTSLITITLKDEFENVLGRGGVTVSISSPGASLLGSVTDHGDGTYTQSVQSPTSVGSTEISATVNGDSIITGNPMIYFVPGPLDYFQVDSAGGGTIGTLTAGAPFDIQVTALDSNDNVDTSFTGTVDLTSSGTISSGGGTTPGFASGMLSGHSLTITSAGDYRVTATNSIGLQTGESNLFTVLPDTASTENSTISPSRRFIENDGTDTTLVTVQLIDIYGNNLITGGNSSVSLSTSAGSLSGVTDQGDGTYTAILTASTNIETATITGTIGGYAIADQAVVEITEYNEWQSTGGGGSKIYNWEDAGNWSLGMVPSTGQAIIIPSNPVNGNNFPVVDTSDPILDFLHVESGANVSLEPGRSLTVQKDVSGDGVLIVDNGTLTLGGDVSIANLNAGNSTVTLNGSSSQQITGLLTTDSLIVQTTGGVTATDYLDAFSLLSLPGSSLTMESGSELVLFNDIAGSGTLAGNNSTITFGGDIASTLSISISTSSVLFNGTMKQSFSNISQMKNLEIDNSAGVAVDTNVTVTQTLTLNSGVLDMLPNRELVANTKTVGAGSLRFRREITGAEGWRMLSSPIQTTYSDFLGNIFTQGYAGSDSANGSPSVLYYDETYPGTENQRWRKPEADTDALLSGTGYFVYFFGNVDTISAYSDPLPDTIDVSGLEHEGSSGEFDFGVTYTTAANTDSIYTTVTDTGWNLIGNPFGASIDWDDAATWTKTNIDSTIYVWDPNIDSAQYRVWNGSIGNLGDSLLGDGVIAPFQGFWVKANASDPVLKVKKSAKTTGGTFYKPASPPPHIKFNLAADDLSASAFFMFSNDGKIAKDPRDGYRLEPLTDTYISLYSESPNEIPLQINNLPLDLTKRQRIPIRVGGFRNGASIDTAYTLRWPSIRSIPKAWKLTLYDRRKKVSIDMSEQASYTFEHENGLSKPSTVRMKNRIVAKPTLPSLKKTAAAQSRFELQIDPYGNDPTVPETYILYPNYPNPFNASTTLRFGLPESAETWVAIYDLTGRLVNTLANREFEAGYHEINWEADTNASGLYFCVVRAGNRSMKQKLMLIK